MALKLQHDLHATHERLEDEKLKAASVVLEWNILGFVVILSGRKSPVALSLWKQPKSAVVGG